MKERRWTLSKCEGGNEYVADRLDLSDFDLLERALEINQKNLRYGNPNREKSSVLFLSKKGSGNKIDIFSPCNIYCPSSVRLLYEPPLEAQSEIDKLSEELTQVYKKMQDLIKKINRIKEDG